MEQYGNTTVKTFKWAWFKWNQFSGRGVKGELVILNWYQDAQALGMRIVRGSFFLCINIDQE